ncbi:MAG: alanine racemase [Steroidobacteraceae bacterium]|nr:alanine racemase [Steroidobacteraceae bacterium]
MHPLREPGRRVLRRGRVLTPGPRAVIDTAAFSHNLQRVREHAPGCRVLAVVKANAYGHGIVTAARSLAADAFAVARLDEALALREAGIDARIVLLEGVQDAGELEVAAAQGLEPFVCDDRQLALLERWRGARTFRVWLKIDSGMGRLGFRPAEVRRAAARLAGCAGVAQPPLLATHLAESEARGNAHTRAQLACFAEATTGLPGERSIANSAGLIAWPEARADWVRPGIMLYGISPFPDSTGAALGLRPVMRFETRVIAVKDLAAGDRVGYGGAWAATGPARIAIAAAGYGDGYPRAAVNGTPVLVKGRPGALAGRVSMDMIAIDVSGRDDVAAGDPVQLWGPELPIERVAAAAGTIAYELACRVSRRVPHQLA